MIFKRFRYIHHHHRTNRQQLAYQRTPRTISTQTTNKHQRKSNPELRSLGPPASAAVLRRPKLLHDILLSMHYFRTDRRDCRQRINILWSKWVPLCTNSIVNWLWMCALCQEYRELKNRGFDMTIGWEGNVQRQNGGVAMAPSASVMGERMSR
ncbi:hypothetical protein F0562_032650 [Nyssa sinensis]|uniref:Uncharacterized protein n=1 Tax=Nyssa sinensis TaxID=561372 RepID=A0A5J5AQD6_9ASTE|nr:hypothetical protein F0562_032650 [Nyssa sinensis]